jgi:hypothetical protein
MSSSLETRYRHLLRWYPEAWRKEHEDVVLGTMLDMADDIGRTRPSIRELGSVVLHGLGFRMSGKTAFIASLIGLILATVAGALSVWGTPSLSALGLSWVVSSLTVGVVPCLAAFGLLAVARVRGFLSPPRAVAAAALSVVAFASSFLSLQALGLAIDAGDEGVAANGLASAFAPILLAGWLTGAAAIAVTCEGALARIHVRRGPASLIAAASGAVGATLIGMSLASPAVSTIAVAGVALVALTEVSSRRRIDRAPHATAGAPARTLRVARALMWTSLAGSAVGIFYAVTGSAWSGGATDGTVAMSQAITVSLISGLPLLGAIVVVSGARARRWAIWGPSVFLAASLCANAVAYLNAPSWNEMAPGLAVSAGLVGAAITSWLAPRLPGPAAPRYVTAALLGLGYASFTGMMLAPLFAILIPLGAVALVIWGLRKVPVGVEAAPMKRAVEVR